MSRFVVLDHFDRINIVSVVDAELNDRVVVGNISKPVGKVTAAFLNNSNMPHDPESEDYTRLAQHAHVQAGYIFSFGRAFEAGVILGLSLGDDALEDAAVYRSAILNKVHKQGVLFGKALLDEKEGLN